MINTNKYGYKTVILLLINIVIVSCFNVYNKTAAASTVAKDSYFEIVRRPQYVMVNYRDCKDSGIHTVSLFKTETDFIKSTFHKKYVLKIDCISENGQAKINTHFNETHIQYADYFIALMYLENDLGKNLSQEQRWQQAAYHLNQSKLTSAKLQLAHMYLKNQADQHLSQDANFYVAQQLLKNIDPQQIEYADEANYELATLYEKHVIDKESTDAQHNWIAKNLLQKITTPKIRSKAQFDLGKYHVRSSIHNPAMEEQYTAMAQQCFEQSELPEARLWSVALKAKAFIKSDQKSQSDCENIQETCENLFKTHIGNYAHAILGILCENGEGNDELENQQLAEQIVFHYRTSDTPAAKFAYAMLLTKGLIDYPGDHNVQQDYILQLLHELDIPKANIILANQLRDPAINLAMNPYQRLHIAAKLYRQADTGSAHFNLATMRLNGEDMDDIPFKSRLMLAEQSLWLATIAGIDEAKTCIESIYDYYNRLKPRDTRNDPISKGVNELLWFLFKDKPHRHFYPHGQSQDGAMRVVKSFVNGKPVFIYDLHTDQGFRSLLQCMKETAIKLTAYDQQLSFDDLLSSWL